MKRSRVSFKKVRIMGLCFSYFTIFILVACTGIASTPDPDNAKDITSINKRLNQQAEQIQQNLISNQKLIENYSSINDEINQLKYELKTTLDKQNTDSKEQELLNILNKVQKKIQILEDRTLYSDSLYFGIVNDMVLIENKISSLILSFKERNDLLVNNTTEVIPKITDEEYKYKYLEYLSYYQNAEWNLSLNGFNYLIQINKNHDLADNCQYWIGEVYYALTDYRRSIKEFEKVSSFPGTNKSDDAQFKMGLCYMNIGKPDRAREEFQKLIEFYPNSEYYRKAQDYINQN